MNNQGNANCGSRIKLERIKRSWTQEKLAELTKLSPRTVQRIESGIEPSLATLHSLADALDIDVEELSGANADSIFERPGAELSRSHRSFSWLSF